MARRTADRPLTLFGVSLMALAACSDGGSGLARIGPPAVLAIRSGDAQSATVATELAAPVVVVVQDSLGRPVPNALVNWIVAQGGGSLFVASTQTDVLGETRNRWTLGTVAGVQTIEARAVNPTTGQAIVYGRVTATALAGPPATVGQLAMPLFLGQRVSLSATYAVRDVYGNPATITPALLTIPTGWAVVGDTLVAPAVESRASIWIAEQKRLALATRDLRTKRWRAGWACRTGFPNDSTVFSATVDTVRYGTNGAEWVRLAYMVRLTEYRTGGAVVPVATPVRDGQLLAFRPDSLLAGSTRRPPLLLTSATPLRYSGGDWCTEGYPVSRAVVLEEY